MKNKNNFTQVIISVLLALMMIPLPVFADDLVIDEEPAEGISVNEERTDAVEATNNLGTLEDNVEILEQEKTEEESQGFFDGEESPQGHNQGVVNITSDKITLSCCKVILLELEEPIEEPLVWTSSNERVATVDSFGAVNAVTEGKATITVESKTSHQTDECEVIVKHFWKETETKAATITSEGIKQYTCVCGATKEDVYYKSCGRKLASGTITVPKHSYKTLTKFLYDGKSALYFFVDVSISKKKYASKSKEGDIRFVLQKYNNNKEKWNNVELVKLQDDYHGWLSYKCGELKEGVKYRVIIDNKSAYKYKNKYYCKGFEKGYATKGKINNGKTIKVKARWKYYFYAVKTSQTGRMPLVKSVKSSNSKVAKGFSSGHRVGIEAKKKGKCTLTITLQSGRKFKTKVIVHNGAPELKYTYINWYSGKKIKNAVLYNNKKVKWTSTNKKVATVSKNGTVTCVKPGTCYVKAKVAGKTLKCKVKVYRLNPDFGAELYYYNTRGNYFLVKFRNVGDKTLTIKSGIKVVDDDYKVFDRKIKLKKKVKIKPYQTKTVKFKVKGSTTWYNHEDFELYYKFAYDGKTYKGNVDFIDSLYQHKKTWWSTYWDYDWYENWVDNN